MFLDDCLKLCDVFGAEDSWDAAVFGVESIEGVENDMQLLGYSKFVPVGNRHFFGFRRIGVSQAFLKIEGPEFKGNFDFSCDSSSDVVSKDTCIANSEAVGRLYFYLEGLSIDLGHAFDFSEGDCVAIVEAVLLLFVKTDQGLLFLSDSCDVDGLALLSSRIEYPVMLSEVNEGVSIETQVAC